MQKGLFWLLGPFITSGYTKYAMTYPKQCSKAKTPVQPPPYFSPHKNFYLPLGACLLSRMLVIANVVGVLTPSPLSRSVVGVVGAVGAGVWERLGAADRLSDMCALTR
jgi:hypothetical protein